MKSYNSLDYVRFWIYTAEQNRIFLASSAVSSCYIDHLQGFWYTFPARIKCNQQKPSLDSIGALRFLLHNSDMQNKNTWHGISLS